MRKKQVEDAIIDKIEKSVDIDFKYSEIEKDVDLSAYLKPAPKPAPERKRKFGFALVGSLAAVAIAVAITVPIVASTFFASSVGKKADMANNAVYDPAANEEAQQGGQYAPGGMKPNEGHGDATDAQTSQGSIGYGFMVEEVEGTYVISDGGVAKILTDDGVYHDLNKNVGYSSADGFAATDKTAFSDGERVKALIVTEVDTDSKAKDVNVGEVVAIKKTVQ